MDHSQKQQLLQLLSQGAAQLREARLPESLAADLEQLATQLEHPCVLAVVGRMKAGKSTFINALLGEDVARVGVTETTATINRLTYGEPADPDKPVRVHWRSGHVTDESRAFLDSLQGNDVATLERADGVEFLEYRLRNPYLQQVELIDTPGTQAAVDEHQNRTAEFLQMRDQMRQKHTEHTERLGREADAVIYLIGPVARGADQDFLDEFTHATSSGSKALNAIGVMAKVDLTAEIMARRHELARHISQQLRDTLNCVIPVSAGMRRALDHLSAQDALRLQDLMAQLRSIPKKRLEKLLRSDEFFRDHDFSDCPVSAEKRRELLDGMDWGVFATIARILTADSRPIEQLRIELDAMSGFGPLRESLDRNFFRRARFLRAYKVLGKARQLLGSIRYRHLPEMQKLDRQTRDQKERFLAFLQNAEGDRSIACEMSDFILRQMGIASRSEKVEVVLKDLDRRMSKLYRTFEQYNADFEALELVESAPTRVTVEQREELRRLFGLFGLNDQDRVPLGVNPQDHARARQEVWAELQHRAGSAELQRICECAEQRYGLILASQESVAQ